MSHKHLRRVEREKESKEFASTADSDDDRDLENRDGRVNKLAALESLLASDGGASPDNSDNDSENREQTAQLGATSRSGNQGKGKKSRKSKRKAAQDDLDVLSKAVTVPSMELLIILRRAVLDTPSADTHYAMSQLWKIDPRSLDADSELRRLIGKLGAQAAESNRRDHRRRIVGKIIKVKQEWQPIRQPGIAIRIR